MSSSNPCTTHHDKDYQHIIMSYSIEISYSYLRQLNDRLIKERKREIEREVRGTGGIR